MAKKRKRRQNLVAKYQSKPGQITHGAYSAMRKCKQGELPPGNTNVGKTLAAIEAALVDDLGPLNALQIVQLNLLRPLLVWWLLHPGTTEKGDLASDFKWIHTRIENGLKRLAELADSKPEGPDLYEQWRKQFFEDQEKDS
jgi:hypothetical protein